MHRKRPFLRFLMGILLIIFVLSIFCTVRFVKARPLLRTAAVDAAKTGLTDIANRAVTEILKKSEISYDSVCKISRAADGRFCGIEIDTKQINQFKSEIAVEISRQITAQKNFSVAMPVGTLVGSKYTTGFGPQINIPIQISQTVSVDFDSVFLQAGINQVLHRITVHICLQGSVLMIGCSDAFSTETHQIVAETVIVGAVPDSFTQVIEDSNENLAENIIDYAE